MSVFRTSISLLLACAALLPATSRANTYQLNFSASNFAPIFGNKPAPSDPIIGKVSFSAASPTAPIDDILSITLDIDGHTYSVDEVDGGFNAGFFTIGGIMNGLAVINAYAGVPDLSVSYFANGLGKESFLALGYTTSAGIDTWTSNTGSASLSAIPEPASALMLILGLGLLSGIVNGHRSIRIRGDYDALSR